MERFSYSRNGAGIDLKCSVRVAIPMVTKVRDKVHYKVLMKTTHITPQKTWEVLRPYSHFAALRKELLLTFKESKAKLCPGCKHYENAIRQFDFPKKHLFSSKTTEVLRHRQLALQGFITMLASHTFTTAPRCPVCSGRVFELVRDFLTTDVGVDNATNDEALSSTLDEETRRSAFAVDKFVEIHPPSAGVVVDANGEFVDSPTKRQSGGRSTSGSQSTNNSNGRDSKKRTSVHSFGSISDMSSTGSSTNDRGSAKPSKLQKGIGSVSDLASIHLHDDSVRQAESAAAPSVDADESEADLNMDFMAQISADARPK